MAGEPLDATSLAAMTDALDAQVGAGGDGQVAGHEIADVLVAAHLADAQHRVHADGLADHSVDRVCLRGCACAVWLRKHVFFIV